MICLSYFNNDEFTLLTDKSKRKSSVTKGSKLQIPHPLIKIVSLIDFKQFAFFFENKTELSEATSFFVTY